MISNNLMGNKLHVDKLYVYHNPRPSLTVERTGSRCLGNCYNATYFLVTSLHPLSMEDFKALRAAGFLGHGQEFFCHQVLDKGERGAVPEALDWRTSSKDVPATGQDEVPCVEIDAHTGKPTGNPPINPYSNDLYQPVKESYFVYECESRVDSGD